MHAALAAGAAVFVIGLAGSSLAQTQEDADAVFALAGQFGEAWNANDAEALALLFAFDGEMVLPRGLRLVGPVAIQEGHAGVFATIYAGTRLSVDDASTRFLTPDVALMRFTQTIVAPPGTEPQGSAGQALMSTMVARKAAEGWLIEYLDAIPEAPADFALPTAPAPAEAAPAQ